MQIQLNNDNNVAKWCISRSIWTTAGPPRESFQAHGSMGCRAVYVGIVLVLSGVDVAGQTFRETS